MKLSILIPMYNESQEVVKPLLDSIAIQQNVDFKDIEAIICVDGGSTRLDQGFLDSYPFIVKCFICEHAGVSATRNSCLDKASGDYVMFCDCDDMFYNACGLYIIFNQINISPFDTLVSQFIEETRDPNGNPVYITHDTDGTFVHGKVHRRHYLINKNIRWNEELTIHEDSYFNILCQRLTDNAIYCPTPFYLWKWRPDSVCRHDKLYLNKTYVNMLKSSTALVNQFLSRGMKNDAKLFAAQIVYDAYYSFNHDRWWTEEGNEFLAGTEKEFAKYWAEFKGLVESVEPEVIQQIVMTIKNRFFTEGLFLERITFNDWIKHIESL